MNSIIALLFEGLQLSIAAVDLAQRAKALQAKQKALFEEMKADGKVSVQIQQQIEDAFSQLEAAGFEFQKPLPPGA